MASKNDDGPSPTDFTRNLEHILEGIEQPDLERLTVEAIRKYRAVVAAAEIVRLDWEVAKTEAARCAERRAELERIHEHAKIEHRASQLVLNNLIDRLGYVPKVSAG